MPTLQEVSQLITELGAAPKTAQQRKVGGPYPADPGGRDGSSDHPTAHVDNDSEPAPADGERGREYASDVDAQVGAPSVDKAPEASPGENEQNRVQPNIGTEQSAVGEDPSVENNYEDSLPDPGGYEGPSDHPTAKVVEKYGKLNFKQAAAAFTELADSILADFAINRGANLPGQRPAASAPAGKTAAQKPPAQPAPSAAMQAGYELAAALGLDKAAAAQEVAAILDESIAAAQTQAELVAGYLKQADDDAKGDSGGDADPAGGPSSENEAGADASPATGGDPGQMPGGLGGGDPGAGAAPPMGGGDPGAGGDLPGGPPSQEEVLQELASALAELGITPEMLAQAQGGAAGGGAPPMGGPPAGAPPMAPPPEAGGMPEPAKVAAAARQFMRSGRFHLKAASPGSRQQILRDQMKNYVLEVMH